MSHYEQEKSSSWLTNLSLLCGLLGKEVSGDVTLDQVTWSQVSQPDHHYQAFAFAFAFLFAFAFAFAFAFVFVSSNLTIR